MQAQRLAGKVWKFANFPSQLTAWRRHRGVIFCPQDVLENFLALTYADRQHRFQRCNGAWFPALPKICCWPARKRFPACSISNEGVLAGSEAPGRYIVEAHAGGLKAEAPVMICLQECAVTPTGNRVTDQLLGTAVALTLLAGAKQAAGAPNFGGGE